MHPTLRKSINFINFWLDKIIDLSPKSRNIALFGSFLLVFLIGYVLSVDSLIDKFQAARHKQIELNKNLAMQNNQLKDLLKYKKKIVELGVIYEQSKQQLNKRIDIELFVNELVRVANNNFVEVDMIKPLDVHRKKMLIINSLQIIINGDYKKIISFVSEISKLPYFIILRDIKITRSENRDNILNMNILLLIYSVG
jgi:Tfp pilus assembly protein PilO